MAKTYSRREYLTLLSNARSKQRRAAILNRAQKEDLRAITEIAHNLLRGRVLLTSKDHNKLKKHRTVLRKIANKRISDKSKKQTLVQKGGFLGTLIPIAISTLASIIGGR